MVEEKNSEEIKEEDLKIGTVIKIKDELNYGQCNVCRLYITPDMGKYKGMNATITSLYDVGDNRRFNIDIDDEGFNWCIHCVEKIVWKSELVDDRERTNFERGDLVKIRTLESMSKQFGSPYKCRNCFSTEMHRLVNKKAVIRKVLRSGDVELKFINAKDLDTDFEYSTDMIEIVEKGYVNNHRRERKGKKMEETNEEIIKEMIGKTDIAKIKKILASSFQMKSTELKGVEKMLRQWAIAKQGIYKMLGRELRISREIEYEAGKQEWKEMLEGFYKQFPGTYPLLDRYDISCFAGNTFRKEGSYFENNIMPEAKDGMKMTTFISKAFKSQDIDTEFSKIIDTSKIKGNITISIDPIDYLLMSLNNSGWSSCHSINKGTGRDFGCYVGRNIQLYV